MSVEFKTLRFADTWFGQRAKVKALEKYTSEGWEVVSETITQGHFQGTNAFCLYHLCGPSFALCGGTSNGTINVTLKRDTNKFNDIVNVPTVEVSSSPVLPKKQDIQPSLSQGLHEKKKTFEPVLGVETDALVKRAFLFLEDEEFDEAERYIEQALRQDPENSFAYLGKLMTELKVHNADELSSNSSCLKEHKLFQRALKFANDEEKIQLERCLETNEKNHEAQKQADMERKYVQALDMMKTINSSTRAQNILNLLVSIAPYKDTEALIQEVSQKKKDIEILEEKYAEAWSAKRELDRLNLTDIEEINRVAGMFEALGDYKDCKSLAEEIRRSGIARIDEAKRSKRIRKWLMIVAVMALIGAGVFYAYTKISERKAEQARIEAEKSEEKSRIEALKLELQGQN